MGYKNIPKFSLKCHKNMKMASKLSKICPSEISHYQNVEKINLHRLEPIKTPEPPQKEQNNSNT